MEETSILTMRREREEEAAAELHPAFAHDFYLFRKKVLQIFGGAFHAYDKNGMLVLYSKQKAFKLKEDFRIYTDENQLQELLTIKTPQILDFGATYYVEDATTGQSVGAIRQRGFKSIFKDEWTFLSNDGGEIGKLTETSVLGAIVSRLIKLVPQTYIITAADGSVVAKIKQHFNPFILKYSMSIFDSNGSIDRRLLISSGILLAAIEGRQNNQ
jgi:uncharacterized protein YxjI